MEKNNLSFRENIAIAKRQLVDKVKNELLPGMIMSHYNISIDEFDAIVYEIKNRTSKAFRGGRT